MEGGEYPRFVCRPGTTEDAWGYRIDVGSADSPEALEWMLADGWYLTPGEWEHSLSTLGELALADLTEDEADNGNVTPIKRRGRPPKQQVA